MALRRVTPGDPWKPDASAHNEFVAATEYVQKIRRGFQQPLGHEYQQTGICLVKNTSEISIPRFGVLGIDDALILPSANLNRFKETPAFKGDVPSATHTGKFCVLLEPLAPGKIGRAVFSGVVAVQLNVTTDNQYFAYADVKSGDEAALDIYGAGSARILHREAGTGLVWARVLLGGGCDEVSYYGRADSVINTGSSGTVSLWWESVGNWSGWQQDSGVDVTAFAPPVAGANITANKYVKVVRRPQRWVIDQEQC